MHTVKLISSLPSYIASYIRKHVIFSYLWVLNFPDSLEFFATDIFNNVDVTIILPNLLSHGLLTPEQRDNLTHLFLTPTRKQQELCGILLQLNEKSVKKFLQCLSETSYHTPHKELLNKIQCKLLSYGFNNLLKIVVKFGITNLTLQ